MKKKSIYLLVVVSLILLPIKVKANVMCNDGSISPSCDVCKPGCCSKHGGCSAYSEPTTQQSVTTPVSNQTVEESKENIIDKDETIKSERQEENDDLVYTVGKNEDKENDDGSVAGGIATLGVIGAAVYGIKKKKGKK